MEQNKICPLLTTNTVVDENNTMKIGTQPVFCVTEQCSWWLEDKQKCAIVVEVVYLTTKEKRLMPTHAEVLCKIPSTALCETIYTVNKDRLGDFVRTCTDKEMEGVNAGILCSLGIAAPVVDGEPVDNSVTVERNLYKHLYEDLLNKVMAR